MLRIVRRGQLRDEEAAQGDRRDGVQHLEKVGTHSHNAAAHEQELERQAVMDTMGWAAWAARARPSRGPSSAMIGVFAIVALLVLITF